MPDKPIGQLPSVPSVDDASLIPVEQGGVASKMTGYQFKQWAVNSVSTSTVVVQPVDQVPIEDSTFPVASGGVYATRVPMLGMGKNLLDNSYFISENNVPINQRGASTYNSASYTIDRWYLHNGGTVALVTQSGVTCVRVSGGESAAARFRQLVPITSSLKGATVTFSVANLVMSSTGIAAIACGLVNAKTDTLSNSQSVTVDSRVNRVSINIPSDTTYAYVCVQIQVSAGNNAIYLKAAKLELGPEQTIARQVNGSWVLNDPIPNYNAELTKCQGHLIAVSRYTTFRATAIRTNYIDFCIPTPTTLRSTATLVNSGNLLVQTLTGSNQSGFTFAVAQTLNGYVVVRATKNSHGLTDAMLNVSGGIVLLSSEP